MPTCVPGKGNSFYICIKRATMKKVILFLSFLLAGSCLIFSQEMNTLQPDQKSGKEVLIGYCNRDGLMTGDFGEMFRQYYQIYHPKKDVVSRLKKHKDGLSILIVLGTWCSDSKEQVPKFFKVLDKMKFDEENLEMIGVDREKKGGGVDVSGYDIMRVPTFIFIRNGKEIGRIIETPVRSLEVDMLGIVGG